MPAETVVDRRNRALLAFVLLTGIRDRALVSLCLRHVDITKSPPLVRQEPDRVETKFAKSINTYFFPVGELKTRLLFGPNDPIFPRTKLGLNEDKSFCVTGIEKTHWSDASPVRAIFRQAFEGAGLPYFSPHSLRHTGHLAQTACRTPDMPAYASERPVLPLLVIEIPLVCWLPAYKPLIRLARRARISRGSRRTNFRSLDLHQGELKR